jgi:predicted hotdog family 3-hydroxylacyl-ACP dehydratase
MVLIDDAIDAGDGWVRAGVRIAEDSLFYQSGKGVPSWAGIEYMAQTIALFSGVQAKRAGQDVRVGFLLGTRKYQATKDYFRLGSYLEIRAQEEWNDGQMAIFDCRIDDEDCLATARLNVFQPRDLAAYLEGAGR